jgi:hypothetical protein
VRRELERTEPIPATDLVAFTPHGYRSSNDQIRSYVVGTADAGFLLNQDIVEYLGEIRNRGSSLWAIEQALKPLPVGNERSALVQQQEAHFSWMMEQLPTGLVARFKPFLTLDIPKHGERRSWFMASADLVSRLRATLRRKVG